MKTLTGQLLVAAPNLQDPQFCQTVTLILQHDEEGAMGLVLNRPSETTLEQVWSQVYDTPCPREEMPLHVGGPCEGPLLLLHDDADSADLVLGQGVCFTSDPEKVRLMVEDHDGALKCVAGYAGWGPGQLETEMDSGSWLVWPAQSDHIFAEDEHSMELWDRTVMTITISVRYPGVSSRVIPQDPTHN